MATEEHSNRMVYDVEVHLELMELNSIHWKWRGIELLHVEKGTSIDIH